MITYDTVRVRTPGTPVLAAFLRGIAVAVVFAGLLAMLPRPASAADDFGDLVDQTVSTWRDHRAAADDEGDGGDLATEPATGDGDTGARAGTNSNGISIYAYLCPAGSDADGNMSVDDTSACTAGPVPPFPFSVSVDGVPFGSLTPERQTGGHIYGSLGGLPAGTITIRVDGSYPYPTPVAFCFAYLKDKMDRPVTRYYVSEEWEAGNHVAWETGVHDLLPNQTAGCYWYYIAPSPSYVYVETFECPAGFDAAIAGPTELKQNCPPATTPVEFILSHETHGVFHELTTAAHFRYLDAGDFTLREAVPAGFGVPIVYCETTYWPPDGGAVTVRQYDRQIMASVDSIRSSIDTVGAGVDCDWFNVPGELPAGSGGQPPLDLPVIAPEASATATPDANADSDGDGITDEDETGAFGTDPRNADTDGDQLSDSNEIAQLGTDPLDPDTDDDGASDHDELNAGTNPLDAADPGQDGGGQGQDGQDGAAGDGDGDGIANADELDVYGTDPMLIDSDDDGLSDAEELFAYGTDPLSRDTDGDALVDGDEVYAYWTEPASYDSDGDGVDDGTEVYDHGTDPLDPASV